MLENLQEAHEDKIFLSHAEHFRENDSAWLHWSQYLI